MPGKKKKSNVVTLSDGTTITLRQTSTWQYMKHHKWLYIMLLPGLLYFILFKYVPMGGLVIAFKEYSPFRGIWGSPWVGFLETASQHVGNQLITVDNLFPCTYYSIFILK